VSLYLLGMDGDKQKDGTTRTVSVPGIGFTGLTVADQTDSDRFSGFTREQITYNGSTPVTVTVNDPWSSLTASQQKSYANIDAYFIHAYKTQTSTYLTATSSWRTRSLTTSFDSYGMPATVYDEGGIGLYPEQWTLLRSGSSGPWRGCPHGCCEVLGGVQAGRGRAGGVQRAAHPVGGTGTGCQPGVAAAVGRALADGSGHVWCER
jgi:hypothetical protein